MQMDTFIKPDWPLPRQVKAYVTTRSSPTSVVSQAAYGSFNLALHVGDNKAQVQQHRQTLKSHLILPVEPCWLTQVHGTIAVNANDYQDNIEADACYSQQAGQVCIVQTADCLPVLFCNAEGQQVAAAHVGWRGLLNGVLENTLQHFTTELHRLSVYLGPAISQSAYQVGEELRQAFIDEHKGNATAFLVDEQAEGQWLMDLYALACKRLQRYGVARIYGGKYCTFKESERFYSYRRDGATGRMASLIWITS